MIHESGPGSGRGADHHPVRQGDMRTACRIPIQGFRAGCGEKRHSDAKMRENSCSRAGMKHAVSRGCRSFTTDMRTAISRLVELPEDWKGRERMTRLRSVVQSITMTLLTCGKRVIDWYSDFYDDCEQWTLDAWHRGRRWSMERYRQGREAVETFWRETEPERKLGRERWRIRGYMVRTLWRELCRVQGPRARGLVVHPLFYLYWLAAYICQVRLLIHGVPEFGAAVLALILPWVVWKWGLRLLAFVLRWGGVL